jgi:hypothetical protein
MTDEQLLEYRKTQIAGLLEENSKLREDLQEGISLRDRFAGLAMQGMTDPQPKFYCTDDIDSVAELAYKQADAMLAEREKRDG